MEGCLRVMSPYRPLTSLAPRGFEPAAAPVAPQNFQFADLIRLIEARRALILRVAVATIIVAVAVALVLPTVYTSAAVVILDPRKNNVTDPSAVLTQLANDPTTVQNQLQIITSRQLAGIVVDRFNLT